MIPLTPWGPARGTRKENHHVFLEEIAVIPLALLAGAVVWNGCSDTDSVVQPAAKPATVQTHDFLDGLDKEQRKAAIGGLEGSLEYFDLMARQVA